MSERGVDLVTSRRLNNPFTVGARLVRVRKVGTLHDAGKRRQPCAANCTHPNTANEHL